MNVEGKKIFITGGAGFIGSALIERLLPNNKVVVYDTFQRNVLKGKDFLDSPNLSLIEGDILDEQKLKKGMKGSNIIIHMAAILGVPIVINNPVGTLRTNVIGTYNVLETATQLRNIERFVNFSTSEVYGTYAYKLGEEETTSLGVVGEARWTYAISKLAGEHMALSYCKQHELPVVSVRPFNIYGPRRGEAAIYIFVDKAIKNEDIEVHGDGDQVRSWCYIDDFVDSILLCLQKKEAIGEVFNIGNPKGTITVLSLAQMIIQACKSNSKIRFVPRPYVDIEIRIPSIAKARKLLGYEPKIDLGEGLKRTIAWYRERFDA
jgi:UDP-glucuronate decarboxylase